MKIFNSIFTTLSAFLKGWFAFFGTLASLVGLYIIFIDDSKAVTIALLSFCFMLISLLGVLVFRILKILEIRNNEYVSKSSFIKYETNDGKKILYENYKLIQCKQPLLTDFQFGFKWSGTHLPIVTSELQIVENVLDKQDNNSYDKAILKFKQPLYYNNTQVIHFRAELDDTDGKSRPYVEAKVKDQIDIIHFRIILKHVNGRYNSNAILEKKKMHSDMNVTSEKIKEIPFDKGTKSYEYHLINPEIGYFYRITWIK